MCKDGRMITGSVLSFGLADVVFGVFRKVFIFEAL